MKKTKIKGLAPFFNYSQERGYYNPTLEEFNASRMSAGLEPVESFDDPKGKAKPFSKEKKALFKAIDRYLESTGWEMNFYEQGMYTHPEHMNLTWCDMEIALSIQLKEDLK